LGRIDLLGITLLRIALLGTALLLLRIALLLRRITLLLLRIVLSLTLRSQSRSRCVIRNLLITSSTLLRLPLQAGLRIQIGFLSSLLLCDLVAGGSPGSAHNDSCSKKRSTAHDGDGQRGRSIGWS
jgi:hypothetical protein